MIADSKWHVIDWVGTLRTQAITRNNTWNPYFGSGLPDFLIDGHRQAPTGWNDRQCSNGQRNANGLIQGPRWRRGDRQHDRHHRGGHQ